jgi:hypothetical protein
MAEAEQPPKCWAKETEGPACFVFFPFARLLRSNLLYFLFSVECGPCFLSVWRCTSVALHLTHPCRNIMIQWFFISGYVLQNMLQVGFGKTFQNLPYFDQSVAYVLPNLLIIIGC